MALQGCPYIASGDNDTIDKISLEDLQGCQYKEYLNTMYPGNPALECEQRCIRDSIYYYQKGVYTNIQNQWVLDTAYYDTALVTIVGPEADGYYTKNFYIGTKFRDIYYDSEKYLNDNNWSSKGWTQCKE